MMHRPIESATTALLAALRRGAARYDVAIDVIAASERPWASLTFTGARHRIALSADVGPAIDAFLNDLPEMELPMRRHTALEPEILTRAATGTNVSATVEIVTIEKD